MTAHITAERLHELLHYNPATGLFTWRTIRPGRGHTNGRRIGDTAAKTLNNANTGLRADNTSGRKGVCWAKDYQQWEAKIQVNGKTHFLGRFNNPLDAHRAYVIAATKHFGEFTRTWSREDERLTKELLTRIMEARQ